MARPSHLDFDARDSAGVPAVEAVGDAQDRGEALHAAPCRAIELCVVLMRLLGRCAAVVPGHGGDGDLLLGRHAQQIGVQDQMVRVLVVLVVIDVVADVVQQRGVRQDLAVARAAADALTDRVEQLQGQRLHVVRVRRFVVRPLGQLAHRSRARLARDRRPSA